MNKLSSEYHPYHRFSASCAATLRTRMKALTLCLLALALLPQAALAQVGPPTGPVAHTLTVRDVTMSGGEITDYRGIARDIIIPETIGGVRVTSIGDRAFAGDIGTFAGNKLTSVTIPNSVTNIGAGAFSYNQLTSVTIPNSVTNIGAGAFSYNQLTSVTIGNSVTSIGDGAFYQNKLTSVTLAALSRLKFICWGAFAQNSALSSVKLPSSAYANVGQWKDSNGTVVRGAINDFSLAYILHTQAGRVFMHTLTTNDVTMIGDTITNYRGSDINIIIPETIGGVRVTSIGGGAFNRVKWISVSRIGSGAFDQNKLTSVTIPNSVTSIGAGAFSGNQLTSITIPNSVTSIGSAAFDQNKLTSITIPNSVTSIGSAAFSYNKLTSITIPNSVTSIGSAAFYGNQLTQVTIPHSVTSIGYAAFNHNAIVRLNGASSNGIIYARKADGSEDKSTIVSYGGTAKVIDFIPHSVAGIGYGAFAYNKLTSITIPNSVTSIGNSAFNHNQLTSVTIPNSVTSISESAFSYNQLTSVTIPNSVTSISESAFSYNQLTSVTIPNSVTSIRSWAFRSNQLTSVTLAANSRLKIIRQKAFAENSGLTSISLPTSAYENAGQWKDSDSNAVNGAMTDFSLAYILHTKAGRAFAYTLTAADVSMSGGTITAYQGIATNIIIPEIIGGVRVTSIGSSAFSGNKLTSVTIPHSVTSIESSAFSGNRLDIVMLSPNSQLKFIGEKAFAGNSKLIFIALPSSAYLNAGQWWDSDANKVNKNITDFSRSYILYATDNSKNLKLPKRLQNPNPQNSQNPNNPHYPNDPNAPLGLENPKEKTLRVSPVPTRGLLRLRLEHAATGSLVLRLSTPTGVVVRSRTTTKASELWQHALDLSDLPQGVYMLEVLASGQRWTQKVVKH